MRSKPPIWLVILLLLVILMVFIAPSVDLEPSALRAIKAAAVIFMGIVVAARFVIRVPLLFAENEAGIFTFSQTASDLHLVQVNEPLDQYCPLLC